MAIKKISANLLGSNAVLAANIAGGAISAADIANNSITAAKLSASTSPTFGGLTVNNNVTINTDANSTFTIADGGTDAVNLFGGSGDELYIGANAAYKLRFKTDGNIVMDNGGSFGIGTNSPDKLLHLKTAVNNTAVMRIESTATDSYPHLEFKNDARTFGIYGAHGGLSDAFSIYDGTAGAHRLTINTSGNVGIGETSPQTPLHISSDSASGENIALQIDNNNTTAGNEISMLFRSRVGTTNTDFKIAGIANAANDMDLVFQSDGQTERMRIDSSGNIGIGTSSPSENLELGDGSSTNRIKIDSPTKSHFIGYDGSDDALQIAAQSFIKFQSGGSFLERMRIDDAGIVMIGTTDSTPFNNTSGAGVAIKGEEIQVASENNCLALNHSDGDGDIAKFFRSGSQVGSISVTSSATAYNTSSDARLKDVTGEARGLEVINELNPVAYNWKESGKADEGLIAQEVQEIVPNAVSGSEEEMYQMDYSKLVVHLVKAVKEQQTQIEALQSEINELKNS